MFLKNIKADIQSLKERIAKLEHAPIPTFPETVNCETCGCMVKKENAIAGKNELRNKTPTWWWLVHDGPSQYIHTPYHCKRCAPKGKK